MFKRALTSAAAIAALILTSTVAKADFVIDTFSSPTPAILYTLGTAGGSVYNNGPTTVAPGVTRTITVTQVGSVTNAAGGFIGTSSIDGKAFQLNTSNSSIGSASYAKLTYTYASAQNLTSGGPVLRFSFDALASPTPFSVVVSNGTTSAIQTGLVLPSSSSTSLAIPLSTFIGTTLGSITSIDLFVNRNVSTNTSSPDADVTLRDVRISQDTPPPVDPVVPAPPAALLLLAAAPAFGLVRFGRRKLGM